MVRMSPSQGNAPIGAAAALRRRFNTDCVACAGACERAKQVVRKGLAAGAQPTGMLDAMLADLDAGRQPVAPAAPPAGGQGTSHSGFSAATAFLPTPAAGAHAQRRLMSLMPTVELAAERTAAVLVCIVCPPIKSLSVFQPQIDSGHGLALTQAAPACRH